MTPRAPCSNVLIIYKCKGVANRNAEHIWSRERNNPYKEVILRNGVIRYTFTFSMEGALTGWEDYTYKCVQMPAEAVVPNRYHRIEVIDGEYSAQAVTALLKGIIVEKPLDRDMPLDI